MGRAFSHVENFTGYMKKVFALVQKNEKPQRILDIPAGNGLLALRLSESGHDVVCGDINRERKDYVYSDMSEVLPFKDNEFDTVICMEGIEHLVEPAKFISELCRICKPDGRIIVSLPNIQSMYSRFQFMCTGTFYQFNPSVPPKMNASDLKVDLGHIAPVSYTRLRYLFKYFGSEIVTVSGDKYKRKVLLPFLLPFIALGYIWFSLIKQGDIEAAYVDPKKWNLFKMPLLFSRSLILEFCKTGESNSKTTMEV